MRNRGMSSILQWTACEPMVNVRHMDPDADDVERLFGLVWEDGVPERERVIFEGLSTDDRAEVLARLEAVWRAENGEAWKPLARTLGLGRSAFFNLRRHWRERSLEGVIPFARQAPRRIETAPDAPIRRRARRLLIEDGLSCGNAELARRLVEQAGPDDEIGGGSAQTRLQWAERLVRHERRALARDGAYLRVNYGRRILVDVSAVSIVLEGERELAVAAFCVDVASGLVLGTAIGRLRTTLELQRSAVDDAWRYVRDHAADRASGVWPPCGLHLMLPPATDGPVRDDELRAVTSELVVRGPGRYAFGRELVQLLGPRIGRIPLAPRRTLAVDSVPFSDNRRIVELPGPEADALWRREVLRHNDPVFRAMQTGSVFAADARWKDRPGVFAASSPIGRMSDVFHAVDGFLREIQDA